MRFKKRFSRNVNDSIRLVIKRAFNELVPYVGNLFKITEDRACCFLEISSRSILDIDSVRIKSHKTQIALMLLISPTTAADYDYLMVEVYFIENT